LDNLLTPLLLSNCLPQYCARLKGQYLAGLNGNSFAGLRVSATAGILWLNFKIAETGNLDGLTCPGVKDGKTIYYLINQVPTSTSPKIDILTATANNISLNTA